MLVAVLGLQLTFSIILPLVHESSFGVREIDIKPWIQESKLLAVLPVNPPKPVKPTPTKQVDLGITLRNQIYTLSCESASLQMALEHFGIKRNQDQILSEIGIAQPYQSYIDGNGEMIWGDPELGFVGNVRGLFSVKNLGMQGATGWGVNKNPVARVAQAYRPESQAYTGFTAKDVVVELDKGNPVII